MTRLFKRKDKTTIAELEEYYANQDQKKNRGVRAWLMALLSIIITILVILALFYAGRWLYRTLTDDGSSDTTTTQGESIDLPTFDGDIVGQGNQNSSENVADPANTDTAVGSGTVSDEAASTSVPNADRIAATGDDEAAIPNTGASELLIIIPITTAIVGYMVSRNYQIKASK